MNTLNPQKISRKRTKEEGWKEAANQSFATVRYVRNDAVISLQIPQVIIAYQSNKGDMKNERMKNQFKIYILSVFDNLVYET